MVAKPLCPLYKNIIKHLDRARYPELRLNKRRIFRKSPRPSLPLKTAPPLTPTLFNGLYTPSVPPLAGDRNLRSEGENRPTVLTFLPLRLSCKESSTSNQAFLLRRKDVTALRCSEPLRSKVGGPSKVFAMVLRDGTAWGLKGVNSL